MATFMPLSRTWVFLFGFLEGDYVLRSGTYTVQVSVLLLRSFYTAVIALFFRVSCDIHFSQNAIKVFMTSVSNV